MKACGAAWVYKSQPYGPAHHANHTCGLPAGHKPEDDGATIHQCMTCQCWANDALVRMQAKAAS